MKLIDERAGERPADPPVDLYTDLYITRCMMGEFMHVGTNSVNKLIWLNSTQDL